LSVGASVGASGARLLTTEGCAQMFAIVFEKLAAEPAWQKILDKYVCVCCLTRACVLCTHEG
jgi:hypothetical protein